MRVKAESRAPRDKGKLADSVVISEKRTRRAKKQRDPVEGIQVAMGPSSGAGVLNYAAFREFGTVDVPADPYMRPAWDTEADGALRSIEKDLGTEITKAAERLARKRAKG